MKKTVKRKVIAGTVVVGLLSGTGVAFGATDAGAGLKSWYDSQFRKASIEVATTTGKHSVEKFLEFGKETQNLKEDATTDINTTRDFATTTATDSINVEKDKYINSVKTKKEEIENNIENEFRKIEDKANSALKTTSKVAYGLAEYDLNKHTSAEGKEALKFLNNEIDKATNNALSELEKEINDTKAHLKTLLDKKSGATIESINKTVDDEITRILGLITTKTEQLVAAHQDAINKKAGELEAASKLKLEERVKELINGK
ncbi:hypothetical protein [Bacillus sp. FJAT-22090]|uniref:hypothetical protein n=1 Tax=Bacillus sp. FJAT-22090 TaxID=1581038 RepID=UPI0011A353AC|nr:hypothetical protein [Bacillus sp. FJAT-22090]